MRDIAHEAKAIIGTYENTRVASILKNMEAENKVVQEISMIKKKIQEITERRIAYGIEHVEAYIQLHDSKEISEKASISIF